MKNEIRLFINRNEIEFSKDPSILLNYKLTELNNPTVVRNSFTKTVTVPGTPTNNNIFSQIWKLDMHQYYSNQFNALKRTDFELFVDGQLYQKGYVKLDNIEMENNSISYKITLYGGLGEFFYNLSYEEDDKSSVKKSLASLKYTTYIGDIDPDLTFTINKETIAQAWGQITGEHTDHITRDKWKVINFVPAYNGIPSDFSADKFLINNSWVSKSISTKTSLASSLGRSLKNFICSCSSRWFSIKKAISTGSVSRSNILKSANFLCSKAL